MHTDQRAQDIQACCRCGTCCQNGGPALHTEDRKLIETVLIQAGALVTIRSGELAFYPMADHPQPVQKEFLKIIGNKADWSCRFYDPSSSSCSIHLQRPSACRALKCWDTEDTLALTGKNLLTRFDFLSDNNPLTDIVYKHESESPCPDVLDIQNRLRIPAEQDKILQNLTSLVNHDLDLRTRAAQQHNLSLPQELFYFGRPLFQIISPLGIRASQSPTGLSLQYCQK